MNLSLWTVTPDASGKEYVRNPKSHKKVIEAICLPTNMLINSQIFPSASLPF